MSKRYRLPAGLRDQLLAADDRRCAYCQTTEANTGQPMTLDYVVPRSQGGLTTFDNLCFACLRCNEYKGGLAAAPDPLADRAVPLFHPRAQVWSEHFAWDASAAHIVGLTSTGCATVVALRMNNPVIVDARRRWVSVGWHPPELRASSSMQVTQGA